MTDRWTGRPGTEREGQAELDRRVATTGGSSDGSGAWGAEADDRGITDHASHAMWGQVATAADAMGLTNAARHMRHYLDNTGTTLRVDADLMLRDVPDLRAAYEMQVSEARAAANERVAAMSPEERASGTQFTLQGQRRSDVYCRQAVSRDWYFAIGGFTYYYTADVRVVPSREPGGAPTVEMTIRLQVRDRYNWDQGKAVQLAGVTVRDEQLGRLHRVGLAREYDVEGQSSARLVSWVHTGAADAPSTMTRPHDPLSREAGTPQARDEQASRVDAGRPTR